MILAALAAFIGTIAFAVLFGVPKKYDLICGVAAAAGWVTYDLLTTFAGFTPTEATFAAALLVTLISRFAAVRMACPATVFLITGIFPLVPGAGIYWTSYYLVSGQLDRGIDSGFAAIKAAIAIVLGIVFVFEVPGKVFQWVGKRQR